MSGNIQILRPVIRHSEMLPVIWTSVPRASGLYSGGCRMKFRQTTIPDIGKALYANRMLAH